MKTEIHASPRPSLGRIRFSEQGERCIDRFRALENARTTATWVEIESLLAHARTDFPISSAAAVKRIWDKNPTAFWRLDIPGGAPAAFAYLPLNAVGAATLVAGELDCLNPDPVYITSPGEAPTALYMWLTIAPGRFARSLSAIAACIRDAAPHAVPIFSRAVTPHAARLNRGLGFEPAQTLYANAPDWLLVIHPEKEIPKPTTAATVMSVRIVRDFEDMAMIYAIRGATYLAEQLCLYSEEFDGNDFCSTQLLGFVNGDPAGCIRIRYFGDFVKFERLAVRREYRNTRLAFKLVREAGALARMKGFTRAYGHAREDLVPFWRVFGGREIEGRPTFRFADFGYREMVFDLGAHEEAIRFGVDPLVSIRPEGAWDEPGPLELSNARLSRAAQIANHTKFIGTKSIERRTHG